MNIFQMKKELAKARESRQFLKAKDLEYRIRQHAANKTRKTFYSQPKSKSKKKSFKSVPRPKKQESVQSIMSKLLDKVLYISSSPHQKSFFMLFTKEEISYLVSRIIQDKQELNSDKDNIPKSSLKREEIIDKLILKFNQEIKEIRK